MKWKMAAGTVLSLCACAVLCGQQGTPKQPPKKAAASASADEVRALRDTVAAQQQQIAELKTMVQRLADAQERAAAANAEPAQRVQAAAEGATKAAQSALSAAATVEKDAQHAQSSAAEARTAVAKQGEKLAGDFDATKKSFLERIKQVGPFSFSGEIRLRGEPFFGGPADQSQVRNRERFRLRFNASARLNDDFDGGFSLTTGDVNSPVSTMQTANQFYTRKPFDLDRAFLAYHPQRFKPLTLLGGKFSFPWVSTELTWDRDLNPEGLAQTLAFNFESAPVLKRVAFVGFELPFAEAAGVSLNNKSIVQSAVYGGQLQTEWQLADWLRLSAYAGFYNWHNSDPVALAVATATAASPGLGLLRLNNNGVQNSTVTTTGTFVATGQKVITNAQFASKFGLFDTLARFDVKTRFEKWPVVLLGNFVQNTKACANAGKILPALADTAVETFAQSVNAPCDPRERRAYWLEGRVGRTQEKGDWNFSYTRMFVEREAVLGVFNYSEMRQGSNVSQHRVEAFYQYDRSIQLGFTGLFGRPLVTASSPGPAENLLKRLQFDVTYKF